MITLTTRVLNGLPIRVEAEIANDRDEGVIIEDMQLYWTKANKNPLKRYTRANVIEQKMQLGDWEMLEEEILDVCCGRWIG